MKTLFLKKNTLGLTDELNQWIIEQGITKVKILGEFNKPIDNLPDTIRTIEFDSKSFNQKINHWPAKLKQLIISYNSNLVFDFFPQTIEHLKMFNYDNTYPSLPISLKILSIYKLSSDKDFGSLINLHSLEISESDIKIINFPPNLKKFISYEYDFPIDNLPKSLNRIKCPIIKNNTILPPKLSYLECTANCERPFDILPKTLTHFVLIWNSNINFESKYLPVLPESLQMLNLVNSSDLDFKPIYPPNLLKLIFEDCSHSIFNLPVKLKELSITCLNKYSCDIPIILPDKLKTLLISDGDATIVSLPSTLTNIDIGYGIKIISQELTLPPKLKYLSIKSFELIKETILPQTLKTISTYHTNSNDYMNLSPSIKHLILYIWHPNTDINIGPIPETIESLEIQAQQKHIHIKKLNNGLKKLLINVGADGTINDEIFNDLPNSIEILDIYYPKSKNTILSNLPNGLKYLTGDFGKRNITNYNILMEKLPESLKYLSISVGKYCTENKYKLDYINLPKNLKYINFN